MVKEAEAQRVAAGYADMNVRHGPALPCNQDRRGACRITGSGSCYAGRFTGDGVDRFHNHSNSPRQVRNRRCAHLFRLLRAVAVHLFYRGGGSFSVRAALWTAVLRLKWSGFSPTTGSRADQRKKRRPDNRSSPGPWPEDVDRAGRPREFHQARRTADPAQGRSVHRCATPWRQ